MNMERIGNCKVFSPKCSKHIIPLLQGLGIVMEEVTERLEKLEGIDDFKEYFLEKTGQLHL